MEKKNSLVDMHLMCEIKLKRKIEIPFLKKLCLHSSVTCMLCSLTN